MRDFLHKQATALVIKKKVYTNKGPKTRNAGVEGFPPRIDKSTGDQNLTATCSRGQQIKLTPNLCGLAGTFSGKPVQADFASSALLVPIT